MDKNEAKTDALLELSQAGPAIKKHLDQAWRTLDICRKKDRSLEDTYEAMEEHLQPAREQMERLRKAFAKFDKTPVHKGK